jgi:hypothetical protein
LQSANNHPVELERGRERMPDSQETSGWTARVALAAAVSAGVYAAAIAATGGFEIEAAGLSIRSHAWGRPALLSILFAVLFVVTARASLARGFARAWPVLDTRAAALALTGAAVIWTAAAGLRFGTFAAGGGDSYGYVSQAQLLAEGRLTDRVPLDPSYHWYIAHQTLTPLGFRPMREPGAIAPTYPPGLPLLMAPAARMSEGAVYVVVPLLGMLTVGLCYAAGRACGDALAGGVAAVLLSVSPTFLFQVVQPMSDVPAAAFWLAAFVAAVGRSAAAAAAAGAAASVAILIRPNLAPLAIVPLALASAAGRDRRARRAAFFVAAVIPAIVTLGWIQYVRYGSPFASGYGDLGFLFSWSNVAPNLARYPRWLTETHTPFIWLFLLAPFVGRPEGRGPRWAAAVFSAGVLAVYLPYAYFQVHEWTYSRFLLPAIPLMLVLASGVATTAVRRLPHAARAPALVALVAGLAIFCLFTASRRHAFELRAGEQRYLHAGEFVRHRLPDNAIVLAAQHSGSVRLYGRRPILRWDLVEPDALDGVLATLRASGRMPFMLLDDFEAVEFRARFDGQAAVRQARLIRLVDNVQIYAFD